MGLYELFHGGRTREQETARWKAEQHETGSGVAARILVRDAKIAMYPVWELGAIPDSADQHYRRSSNCVFDVYEHHQDFYTLPAGNGPHSVMIVTGRDNMLDGHVQWMIEQFQSDNYQVDVKRLDDCGCTTLTVSVPGVPSRARHARR